MRDDRCWLPTLRPLLLVTLATAVMVVLEVSCCRLPHAVAKLSFHLFLFAVARLCYSFRIFLNLENTHKKRALFIRNLISINLD